jgi:hypothetical protein
MVRKQEMDNRWVVPYNPYLLNYFNCHSNYSNTYTRDMTGLVSQLAMLPSMTTMEELMKPNSIGMQGGLLLQKHSGEFMVSISARTIHLSCNFNFIYRA